MKKKNDIDESVVTFEVDKAVIEGVRSGEIRTLILDLREDNQNIFLETADGHLLLDVEELPNVYRSCYFWNGGVFPYILKRSVEFFELTAGDDRCLAHIIRKTVLPGTRFTFQKPEEPGVEDPDGDCCVWQVNYDIIPLPDKPKTYLMRWNPAISSFTEQDYAHCVEHQEDGHFFMDWSIYEWEEARRGDIFYMLRTGDDKAGIVFNGYFMTDPYTGEDWKGTTRRRCYVDMACCNAAAPDAAPQIPLQTLKEAIPSIDWDKGHSGELLSDDVVKKLSELWNKG